MTPSTFRKTKLAKRRSAFTRVGVLVLLAVIALGFGLLFPAIQSAREISRRSSCLNNAQQLGLALQNYASTYANALPPAAGLYGTGAAKTVGGYSFLVKILPFMDMEYGYLCKSLHKYPPSASGVLPYTPTGNTPICVAGNTSLKGFVCPSNNNPIYADPSSTPPQGAFTNYKAVGASTRNSLLMVTQQNAAPPYGTAKMHPDGVLYPSDKNLPMDDLKDGTSHTILAMETMDDTNSRWMVGAECTLVGLPQVSSPTGEKPGFGSKTPSENSNGPYFAPPGFDYTFGDDSAVAKSGLRTFLGYDFSPTGADAGKYEDPGWAKPPAYGPSSAHPAVAIVTMGDGSVMALNKRVDAASLFFLITKDNNDPFSIP